MKVGEPLVYLLYFCSIASRLICCSLCGVKEEAEVKLKRENNLQGDRSFNDLQNMLFLVSSLAQVAQMTVFGLFAGHICITFWVELNVNKVYMSQATFFVAVAAYIQYCIQKCAPLVIFCSPYCEILATGLTVVNVTTISWVKFSSFGRHKTKNNWYTMFSITGAQPCTGLTVSQQNLRALTP